MSARQCSNTPTKFNPFNPWRVIPETNRYYAVSSYGHVKRIKGGRGARLGQIHSLKKLTKGYPAVTLNIGGKRKGEYIHRLVARAWLGPCPDGLMVNHKNGVKTDNRVENLEYVTCLENKRHAIEVLGNPPGGKLNLAVALSDVECLNAIRRVRKGEMIKIVAKEYDVTATCISTICSGHRRSYLQALV